MTTHNPCCSVSSEYSQSVRSVTVSTSSKTTHNPDSYMVSSKDSQSVRSVTTSSTTTHNPDSHTASSKDSQSIRSVTVSTSSTATRNSDSYRSSKDTRSTRSVTVSTTHNSSQSLRSSGAANPNPASSSSRPERRPFSKMRWP